MKRPVGFLFKKDQFLVLLAVLVCSGCAGMNSWSKPDLSKWTPPGPPAKALAVWEPAVRHDGGEKPMRGFGGRVYFYDQEAKRPIKVKGNVVVYAFDEDGRSSDDNVPTRSYFFDQQDIKKLHSKSKLGPSYNFWIPWDTEGPDGAAKKISLIVRFVPDVGSSVVSSQAVAYLPGKRNQTELMAKAEWEENRTTQGNAIRQTAHRDDACRDKGFEGKTAFEAWAEKRTRSVAERLIEANADRPSSMQTATISLPNHRLATGLQAALAEPMALPKASEIRQATFLDTLPAEERETGKSNTAEKAEAPAPGKATQRKQTNPAGLASNVRIQGGLLQVD